MDERERDELEADIEKIHHTLEANKSQWQYYDYDSDDDSEEDDDALFIDLDKQGSVASTSVASLSIRSAGGRTTPSFQSITSQETAESLTTENDEDPEQLFRVVGEVLDNMGSTADLPASLESCLIINRAYQDIIREHIDRIDLALAENREAQRKLEEDVTDGSRQQQTTKKRFPYTMVAPYFRSSFGSCPAANEDTKIKISSHEPDVDRKPELPWYQRHRQKLYEAVKEDALEKLLQPLLSRRELEEEKILNCAEKSEEWYAIRKRIADIDEDIAKKKETSADKLLRSVDVDRVDWMKISNLVFGGNRDWKACKRVWQYCVDPKINMTPVTADEAEQLKELVKETDGRNWVYIAQQLGTGRTAFQCLQYYQQNLNRMMIDRPWSAVEDKQLIRVVEKCQQYHFNWHKVSQYIEGRSATQCYKRFSKIDPNRNTGFWTESEDAQLMAAVELLGSSNWGRVQELVPGRTREQCRERYINSLDPAISGKPWTYEEDKLLLMLIEKHGKASWVKISKEMPGRTDNQILQRYRRLEDWKKRMEWFRNQPKRVQNILLGNTLPSSKKDLAFTKNWEQFKKTFAVDPEDYIKLEADKKRGEVEVPRPPFLLGFATSSGQKIWNRRMQLRKLIEDHVQKLRKKVDEENTGVLDLQDAISSLSHACIQEQERIRNERLAQILPSRPNSISVKQLLAISKGQEAEAPVPLRPRLPSEQKIAKINKIKQELLLRKPVKKCPVETEMKRLLRTKLREPLQKKGRPRKFFWREKVEQGASQEEMDQLRSSALHLYLKSLGADPGTLLANARTAFPELVSSEMPEKAGGHDSNMSDQDEPTLQSDDFEDNPRNQIRRSRRPRKPREMPYSFPIVAQKPKLALKRLHEASAEVPDPATVQRKKIYDLLDWICKMQRIAPNYPPPDEVSMEVNIESDDVGMTQMASNVEVIPVYKRNHIGTTRVQAQKDSPDNSFTSSLDIARSESVGGVVDDVACVVPHKETNSVGKRGMALVYEIIQQAHEESQNKISAATATSSTMLSENAGGMSEQNKSSSMTKSVDGSAVVNADESSASTDAIFEDVPVQGIMGAAVPSRTIHTSAPLPLHRLPNLPPSACSLQSFKLLLLKRLELIKNAGNFYDTIYYNIRKDTQMRALAKAGLYKPVISKGTVDLSRLMTKVSEEAGPLQIRRLKKKIQTNFQEGDQTANYPSTYAEHDAALNAVRQSNEYRTLQARFNSLFLWPALLSALYPPFQRSDFANKAVCLPKKSRVEESENDPNITKPWQHLKSRLALLKSKRFYKFANKTRAEKTHFLKKRHEKRVIRQVQELLADPNDPELTITLTDYDNESQEPRTSESSNIASPHNAGTSSDIGPVETTSPLSSQPQAQDESPVKRTRKPKIHQIPGKSPIRHSSRNIQRVSYSDRINQKRTIRQTPVKKRIRSEHHGRRLHKSVRAAMIEAMLAMQHSDSSQDSNVPVVNEEDYFSDQDEKTILGVKNQQMDWLGDLPEDQKHLITELEKETQIRCDPKNASLGGLTTDATEPNDLSDQFLTVPQNTQATTSESLPSKMTFALPDGQVGTLIVHQGRK